MNAATDVVDLVQQWADAEQQNDRRGLEPLLADDFVGVGPLGFVLPREQWLARFDNGLRNTAFGVQEPQTRDYGSAAVVTAVLDQQTSFQGQDNSGRYRLTLVAVRPVDCWLLAHAHLGNLHNPADGPPRP